VARELADHAALLQLVDLDHRREQLEVVARVGGELLERERVLRKARAAVADARAQEMRPEPLVEPDPLRNLDDVGAGRLADIRDLVDERDPRHQERIRSELDHLRGVDVGTHDRCVDAGVETGDRIAVLGVERADRDAVGIHEVANGTTLGQEFGIRDVADVVEAALVETGADLLARADRNGRLHDEDRPALQLGQLVDDRPDAREVGIP
jgi:hypothetical protein